jgi:hypothetical protein
MFRFQIACVRSDTVNCFDEFQLPYMIGVNTLGDDTIINTFDMDSNSNVIMGGWTMSPAFFDTSIT